MDRQPIDREKDNIILKSISIYGSEAVPQNYKFLSRYGLKNLYYDILNCYTGDEDAEPFEAAMKTLARKKLPECCSVPFLSDYKKKHGNIMTKELLDGSPLYWKVFTNLLKRRIR